MRERIINTGLAIATAATMAFIGEVRPVSASQSNTEVTRTTPVLEPYVDINPQDAQTFRTLMGNILNPEVNPQVFSTNLTSPRFTVTPAAELAPGIISETGYSWSPEPGVKTPDQIIAIVSETREGSYQSIRFSLDPEGKLAVADPRVQYDPDDLISGVNKALKNAPDNWRTTNYRDYTESRGSTVINGETTNYLLFGDGFVVVGRSVPR